MKPVCLVRNAVVNAALILMAFLFSPPTSQEALAQSSSTNVFSGAIKVPGERDVYEFVIPSSSRYYFDSYTDSSGVAWTLAGPQGEVVQRTGFNASDANTSGNVAAIDLPASTYRITVQGVSGATNNYAFRFVNLADSELINPDTVVTNQLIPSYRTDFYKFNGTAGDQFQFKGLNIAGNQTIYVRVIDPFGREIQAFGNRTTVNLNLSVSGTFLLLVEGAVFNTVAAAPYSFTLNFLGNTPVPPLTGTPLVVGNTIPFALLAGETNQYTFSLAAPTRLVVDSLTNSASVTWTLRGPSGQVANRSLDFGEMPQLEAPAGDYQLTVRNTSAATRTGSFRVLNLSQATPINLDTWIEDTLTPGPAVKTYRFTGTAGQSIYLDAQPTNQPINASFYLISPFGGDLSSSGIGSDRSLTLPITGTYTLVLNGYAFETSGGSYSFRLVTPEVVSNPLVLGTTINGALSEPGERDSYKFTISQPTRVSFDALTNGNVTVLLRLVGGANIFNRGLNSSDWRNISDPLITLEPGDYEVLLSSSGDATPAYAFRILDAASASPTSIGQERQYELNPANRTAIYSFNATAGQRLYWSARESTGMPNASVRVYDSENELILSADSSGGVGPVTVRRSGVHYLLVEGYLFESGSGSFKATLYPVQDVTTPINLGEVRTDQITTPGQKKSYTFTANSQVRLYFDYLSGSSSLQWNMDGAFGRVITQRSIGSSDWAYQNDPGFTLLEPGSYTLNIQDTGSGTNSYSFRLLDVGVNTPLSLDTDVAYSLPTARETLAYSFTVGANTELYFDVLNRTGGQNMYWRLISPFSTRVFQEGFGDVGPVVLNFAGNHILLLEGYSGENNASAATGTFRVRTVTDGVSALSLNTITTGSLTSPGQQQRYEFTLATPTRLYFDSLTNRSDFRWSITGVNGKGPANRTFSNSDAQSGVGFFELPAGAFTLTVSATADQVGTFVFQLLNADTAPLITPGVANTVFATNNPANQTRIYRFNAAAGDQYRLGMTNVVSLPNVGWRVVSPFLDVTSFNGYGSGFLPYSTTASGIHYILAEGYVGESGAGSYRFLLNLEGNVPPNVSGSPFNLGDVVAGTIPGNTTTNRHVITINSARKVMFDFLNNVDLRWNFSGPPGAVVTDRWTSSSDGNQWGENLLDLPAGTYVFRIWNPANTSLDYSFRLLDASAGTPLTYNTLITNSLSANRISVLYRFTPAVGSRLYLDTFNPTGFNQQPSVKIFDPAGGRLAFNGSFSDAGPVTTTLAGEHTLAIEGNIYDNGTNGTYRFKLNLATDTTAALTVGALVQTELTLPTQTRSYTFNLAASKRLFMDVLTNQTSGSLFWRLRNGFGLSIVEGRNFTSSDSFDVADSSLVLAPGNYTLTVYTTGDDVGTNVFRLLDASTAPALPIGSSVTNVLNPVTSTVLYQFNGTAGARYYFDGGPTTGHSYVPSARLYSPQGTYVVNTSVNGDFGDFALPSTGTYVMAIEARYFEPGSSSTLSFALKPVVYTTNTLNLATVNSGSISSPGEQVHYVFTVPSTVSLLFDSLTDAPLSWTLFDSLNDELVSRNFGSSDSYETTAGFITLEPGTYRILVRGNGASTGNYAFRFLDPINAKPVVFGTLVQHTLDPGSSSVLFSFDALKGDRFYFDGRSTSGGSYVPRVRFFTPSLTPFQDVGATSNLDNFEVPTSGSYTIAIEGRPFEPGMTNRIQFVLYSIPPQVPVVIGGSNPPPDLVVTSVQIPANGNPGQSVPIVWTLRNQGTGPAAGVWSDQLFLSEDNAIGNDDFLASISITASLAAGQELTRTQFVTLPAFAAGTRYVVVAADGANRIPETSESNNAAISLTPIQIPVALALTLSPVSVIEGSASSTVTGYILRNSGFANPLAVNVIASPSGRVSLPATVTIPATRSSTSFAIQVLDNALVESNVVVQIQASAAAHTTAQAGLTILENDLPELSVVLSTNRVSEAAAAGTLTGTVSRNANLSQPLTVNLLSDRLSSLTVPQTVTIPAGQISAPFVPTLLNNTTVDGERRVNITASAQGYPAAGDFVFITEDDTVALSLSLSETSVTEGGVNPAAILTIRRTPANGGAQRVRIASDNALLTFATEVTIPAGQPDIQVPIQVGDDDRVTGPRAATLSVSALTIDGFLVNGAFATLPLTILDNDGPKLTVTADASVISESGSTTVSVRRNIPSTNDVTVLLNATPAGQISLPASVVLLKGQDVVSFVVQGVADGVSDGIKTVTISATAGFFNPGSAQLAVTDIDVPDLTLDDVSGPATVLTDGLLEMSFTVTNSGLATASGTWIDRVYLATDAQGGGATLVSSTTNINALAENESYTATRKFLAPSVPGIYWLVVSTDATNSVLEASERNNTVISTDGIAIAPAYRATVATTVDSAISGTAIPLTGRTFFSEGGAPAPNRTATIRIRVGDVRRVLQVTSDASGNFATTFQPIPGEAGVYLIGADHPRVVEDPTQDQFILLGMRATPLGLNLSMAPSNTLTGTIEIRNLSPLPLTGLQVAAVSAPPQFSVNAQVPGTLAGNQVATLQYQIGTTLSTRAQGTFRIRITSTEGAQLDIPVNFILNPPAPQLIALPSSLQRGMLRGTQTLVSFTVINQGGAESGDLNVVLPVVPWMSLVTTSTIPSLAPGETNNVVLALNPAANLPLTRYDGSLALVSPVTSLNIPFQFRALSDALGDLKVVVTDENTYYVTNSPKVVNAFVQVRDPLGGTTVAQGYTDANGEILFTNIREGDYEVVATADKHGGNQGIVRLIPGVTTTQEVFLSRQSVTYTWTVVPTEYEDRYRVVLEPKFETEVPYPNLIIENPQIIPLVIAGRTSQFDVRYRNNGLVALRQVKVQIPTNTRYIIKPLVDVIEEIPAQSTLTVPFTIRLADNPGLSDGPGCDNCVVHIPIDTSGLFRCGQNFVTVSQSVSVEPLCIPDTGCLFDLPDVNRIDFGSASQTSFNAQFDCLAGRLNECQKARIRGYLKHGDFGYVSGPFGDGISDFCACTDEPHIPALLDFAKDYLETLGFSFPPGSNLSTVPALISGFTIPGPCNFPAPSLSDAVGSAANTGTGPQLASSDTPTLASGSTEKAVCAKVRIQISQDITLTRTAFRGTLSINNDSPDAITGIRVDLDFRDAADLSSGDRFVITGPVLTGLSDVNGGGSIAAGATASAEYTFYPKLEAAPTGPAVYRIGGSLRYIEGGQEVVLPLTTTPITVLPEARLELEYFIQRDVYSDDPFTPEVEPAEPFSLGLRLKNVGAGDARKFRIATGQPKIIENEKGLLIDFKLLGTRLGDKALTPSFEVNVGDIPSAASRIVTWDLTSSLQGKFIDYRASFEHVNALGGVNLSLIQKVVLHEMIHLVRAARPNDDTLPDFLVNDTPDPDNLPDVVYLSDGSTVPVAVGTGTFDGQVSDSDLEVQLTVNAAPGWMYFRLPNPGPDHRLVRVLRGDGKEVRLTDNAWTTDRSFPSALPGAVREKLVHLFDFNPTATYRLQYNVISTDTNAPTSQVVALPAGSPTTFAVQWSGSDNAGGSGIASYDIYVSANGEAFTNWIAGTSLTSALFPGTFGSTYAFYSRARDGAGNVEDAPATPDASTKVEISANRPPTLTSIPPQTVDEGESSVFTASANDPDLPAQNVTFTLAPNAPSGAVIEPNSGIFRWTTGESDGGKTFTFGIIGTDNGSPSLSTTQSVSIAVRELNSAPSIVVPSPGLLSADEGKAFTLTLTATDNDLPANTLTWQLGGNAPQGMTINAGTGLLSWTPPESAGPGQVNFSVTVKDNGSPSRSDTKNFTLTVNEVNRNPVLDPISDGSIAALETFSAVVTASDPDLPAQSLAYSLAPGAPKGAGINRRTGQLIFRSSRDTAGRTNLITVRVTDTGTPPLSDSKTIKVVVGDYFEIGLGQTSLLAGSTSSVPISVYNTFASKGGSCEVTLPTSRFSQVSVKPAAAGTANLAITPLGNGVYRITVQSAVNPLPSGSTVVGDLFFTAVAGQASATVPIAVSKVTGLRANGTSVNSAYGSDGRVVIVGTQPVLEATRTRLLLYGNPGQSYRVESTSTLAEPIGWTPYWTGSLTDVQQSLPLPPAGQTRFFRAVQ